MNTVAKILVVFITATSLAFLAFAIALRNGGPDWMSEIRSNDSQRPTDIQKEVTFTVEPGEIVTYSAKHRRSETSIVDKTPILAEVVVKARKKIEDDMNKRLQELSPQPQQLQDAVKVVSELIPVDRQAVEKREENYNQRIQGLWTTIENVGNQFAELTVQTQEILRLAKVRRDEVYRLSNMLELLRNDHSAAVEQRRVLEDELIRLEENKRRLERRRTGLQKQLGEPYDTPADSKIEKSE